MISSCEIRRSSFSLHLPDHSPAFDTILHGLLLDTLPSLGFWDITRPTNFDGRPFSISPVVPFFFLLFYLLMLEIPRVESLPLLPYLHSITVNLIEPHRFQNRHVDNSIGSPDILTVFS